MPDISNPYLRPTPLLDFDQPAITKLVQDRGWRELPPHHGIGAVYDFVRNEIPFGYNAADNLAASAVIGDGYGQCNTKATVLMALLRAIGIPCRLHGFTIDKALQRGIVPEAIYPLTPDEILHSWVEIDHDGGWISLEGFIVDDAVLGALQRRFGQAGDSLCAYGVGTDCLSAPGVQWTGTDTYIQRMAISRDFGVFADPDAFYAKHRQKLGLFRDRLYRHFVRHWMNARVRRIRKGDIPPIPPQRSEGRADGDVKAASPAR